MTEKDITITVTAYQKSVIESGAKPEDWAELTLRALNNHSKIVQTILNKMKENS